MRVLARRLSLTVAGDPGWLSEEEKKGREERKHARENIVLRVIAVFGEEYPVSCGLIDVSVGGARLKIDSLVPPPDSCPVVLSIESLKIRLRGKVLRSMPTTTGAEVAVRFDEQHGEVPGRLLEYKLRSYREYDSGRMRRAKETREEAELEKRLRKERRGSKP